MYNNAKKYLGSLAGKYTKSSKKVNGRSTWINEHNDKIIEYNTFQFNRWVINQANSYGGKLIKGIYGPRNIACPALIGNQWKYSQSERNINNEGGNDITVKCLGLFKIHKQ